MTNWSAAMRTLAAQLVCRCGAANTPDIRTNPIKIDDHGNASCDACGAGGALQLFLPPDDPTYSPPRRRA